MKRIIEELMSNGKKRYRVERKDMFMGFTINGWHTDCIIDDTGVFDSVKDAIFDTLEEAQDFCQAKTVISHKIIKTYK